MYWKAFLVSLLLAMIGGGIPSFSVGSGFNLGEDANGTGWWGGGTGEGTEAVLVAVLAMIVGLAVVIALAGLAFLIFLRFPLDVGAKQYYKQAAQGDVNLNYLAYSFEKGKYLSIVKSMLLMNVQNFLWFLLLVVPGIVKTYSYSMVPYLLADNPKMGAKRAIEISNRMTRGHKWKIFVLDLSFIGWYVLGTILLMMGTLFVLPYVQATKAELYLELRRRALDKGTCIRAELGLQE
jgi:uncharacterized membrane protein